MSISNLHVKMLCWTQFGTLRWFWELQIQSGCLWLAQQRAKRCTFKVSLKCDFLGTFHQEISCLRKPGIYIYSLTSSTSFLNVNEKISFLYNPLLLKLKSLKTAVYMLHCTRVIEGSQVSFQPGEQQKLVLYKLAGSYKSPPIHTFSVNGALQHMESRTQSFFSACFIPPRNLLLLQQ